MFDTLCLQIGEKVVARSVSSEESLGIPALARKSGVIHAFGQRAYGRTRCFGIRPGIYCDRSSPLIVFDDDPKKHQYRLSAHFVDLMDERKQASRERDKYLVPNACWRTRMERDYLRPLPPAPYCEGDIVRLVVGTKKRTILRTIVTIDYDALDASQDGSLPAFGVAESVGESFTHMVSADELELFERGNVWRKNRGEPVVVRGEDDPIEVECALAVEMGNYDIILPTATVTPGRWTKKTSMQAIRNGEIDWLIADRDVSDLGPAASSNYRVLFGIKFFDQDLGIRLAHRALRTLAA